MGESVTSKAKELLEKALESCPADSTGRLAVLGAGFALLEIRAELSGFRAELRIIREALEKLARPAVVASRAEMRETFGALAADLPSGISKLSMCKTCDAPIYWCSTTRGRKMPLDARVVEDAAPGMWAIRDGIASKAYDGAKYSCHFETCPDADEHRRPRESSRS